MDEPLSNLDAKLRLEMRAEIRGIHDQIGSTTIYVTHDQDEALSLADRIVVMSQGHIEQIGSPEDLYQRPDQPSTSPISWVFERAFPAVCFGLRRRSANRGMPERGSRARCARRSRSVMRPSFPSGPKILSRRAKARDPGDRRQHGVSRPRLLRHGTREAMDRSSISGPTTLCRAAHPPRCSRSPAARSSSRGQR